MRSRWSRVSLRAASRPAAFDFSLWQVTQYRSRTARWVEADAVPEAFEDCDVGPVAWPAATRAVTTITVQPTTSSRFFIGRPRSKRSTGFEPEPLDLTDMPVYP